MRQVIALVGCLCLFLQGCTAMQPVPVPQAGSATSSVQVSDAEAAIPAGEPRGFKIAEVWALGGALLAVALIPDDDGGRSDD
jgi:hypothetical protein